MSRICNLTDGMSQLARATADLHQRWAETQMHWNDETSKDFEKLHLASIPGQLQMLTVAVQALASAADKAAKDLNDPVEEW
jgi:hypothetical protein